MMMKMMKMVALVFMLTGVFASVARAGWDPAEEDRARNSVESFKVTAPWLSRYFEHAYGYAVFPEVFKGGLFIVGGGHGKGFVYEQNRLVGRSSITQLNVGPQLGGQSFSEIVFFRGQQELENFKKGNFELNAQVTAIVVTASMATNIDYSNGVAVFVLPRAGVMAEATVGGQKFSYNPYQ
jgi:lipid-binding SYLF domain-containing protein